MSASCSSCALWDKTTSHGRGTVTGFCTHPVNGKTTRGDYSCPYYQRAYGKGFDSNVAFDAFHRLKAGKVQEPVFHRRKVDSVPLGALRRRSGREAGRR